MLVTGVFVDVFEVGIIQIPRNNCEQNKRIGIARTGLLRPWDTAKRWNPYRKR